MLSKRVKQINPSLTLGITAKAKEMKASGIDVISFGAGEPDFDTPIHVKKIAIKAINEGFTKYTATGGMPELKNAICAKLKRDNNLKYLPSEVIVSNGAKQVIFNIIQALIDPGDEVLIPVPYWVSYEEMVKLSGGKCVFLKNVNFKVNDSIIKKALTKKTKLLIINTPVNPTGIVYSRNELKKIAEVCAANNIFVISDEIYEKIIYNKKHFSIAGFGPKIKALTITVNGVSKSFAMTGWRIGYAAGNAEIIKAAINLQDHTTSNPNSIAQKAAIEALVSKKSDVSIKRMIREYKSRRDYAVRKINAIKGLKVLKPDGAFYLFVDIHEIFGGNIKNSVDFCRLLLEQEGVATIPGSAFGDDNYIRISYATSFKNIKNGLERIDKFIKSIQNAVN